MGLTTQQKQERVKKMQEGKRKKAEGDAARDKLLEAQAAEIDRLTAMVSEKNVEATTEFLETDKVEEQTQSELEVLRQELNDLKVVLQHNGALPKKVATSQPWNQIGSPFRRDIFYMKKQHDDFELGFIESNEEELDSYLMNGYTLASGKDWGEKEGVIKRKGLIAVERPIAAGKQERLMLRSFNLAQRTSALQKTEDMSKQIMRASGHKVEMQFGYEGIKDFVD